MNPTLILRIAAVFSLLFATGHTLGGRKDWSPMGDTEVLKSMRTTEFETMNVKRTYLDFFRGFGYSLSVFLLLQAVVLWQLGTVAATNAAATRPMIVAFIIASIANAGDLPVLSVPDPCGVRRNSNDHSCARVLRDTLK